MWKKSLCLPGWLHSWRILQNTHKGVIEVCEKCHKKRYQRKDILGNINNYQYLEYHLKEALQPIHPRYNKEHGK